jgi:hypothetical protein
MQLSKPKKHEYGNATHWNTLLRNEFEKESDRAAVILTASLFDHAITQLLRITFVPAPVSEDQLFDSPNAPLASFSAKINMAYRIGLISKQFCRDLHLIRAIRNNFAHNVSGCTFENASVRSRVLELAKSSGIIDRSPKIRAGFPNGPRGDFLMCSSWMLYSLNKDIEESAPMKEAFEEWGYDREFGDDDDPEDIEPTETKKIK